MYFDCVNSSSDEKFSCYKTNILTCYTWLNKYQNLFIMLVPMYSFMLKLVLLASFVFVFTYCLMHRVHKGVIKSVSKKGFEERCVIPCLVFLPWNSVLRISLSKWLEYTRHVAFVFPKDETLWIILNETWSWELRRLNSSQLRP